MTPIDYIIAAIVVISMLFGAIGGPAASRRPLRGEQRAGHKAVGLIFVIERFDVIVARFDVGVWVKEVKVHRV